MLIELVVALSIGLVVILQLSTFLVGFVPEMYKAATRERRLLQEGVVLDLVMQDLCVAVQKKGLEHGGVVLDCWRMRGKENPRLIKVHWQSLHRKIQRNVDGSKTPQVFGEFLNRFYVDVQEGVICFVDVDGKGQCVGF